MLRSDIPSSSSPKSAKSSAPKPSPLSALGASSSGPVAAAPTRGEILAHLEGISRKPRSVKRRKTESPEKDQSAPAKVQKLTASSSPFVQRPGQASLPLAFHVSEPERGSPLLVEVPSYSGPLPPSAPIAEAGNPSGVDGIQPLAAVPLSVWKVPSDHVKLPPRKSVEPKRRPKPATADEEDSLLSNAELAASAVSSILKEYDVVKSKGLPVDEVLASSFQGLALVSLSSCF